MNIKNASVQMKKLSAFILTCFCVLPLFAQDINDDVYRGDGWEFELESPQGWRKETYVDASDKVIVALRAFNEENILMVTLYDILLTRPPESNPTRLALTATVNENKRDFLETFSEATIVEEFGAENVETSFTEIGGEVAYAIEISIDDPQIPVSRVIQYIMVRNAVVYVLSLSRTPNSTEAQMQQMRESVNTFLITEIELVVPTSRNVGESLLDAAKKGFNKSLFWIPLIILGSVFGVVYRAVKWKRSKMPTWAKRREKIWKSTDIGWLKDIAMTDENEECRSAASDRIKKLTP